LSAVRRFASDQIPSAANRFAGTNRGQFSNPEWDDVGLRLRTALDDDKRIQLERELLSVLMRELPALPMQYELQAVGVLGFKGLIAITGSAHTGNIMHTWNVHEWEML
jgi:ABC-type transport system substrate-binding protein